MEKKDDTTAEPMEVDDIVGDKETAADGDKNTITITKDAAAEMKGALAVDALKGEEGEKEAPAKKKQRSNSTDEVVLSAVAKADDEVAVTKSSVSSQKEKEADQKGEEGKEEEFLEIVSGRHYP